MPEVMLQAELRHSGIRFSMHVTTLPGCPDLVFRRERIVVFCDGDFWHGRGWALRKQRLSAGANAEYWIKKIQYNRRRDRALNRQLRDQGWTVLRFWESSIKRDPGHVAAAIVSALARTWAN
jgi:DNA mismatch endonuclease, patch repair protein